MVQTKGWVFASVAALTLSGWGGLFLTDPRDQLLKDVDRLAKTHRLEPAPLEKNELAAEWFGRPAARYESTRLTKVEKKRLWAEFVKTMTPYGEPYGPMCGFEAMGYAMEGIEAPFMGSGRVGLRDYSYTLEETSGPVHTVVLELYCRTDSLEDIARRAVPRTP